MGAGTFCSGHRVLAHDHDGGASAGGKLELRCFLLAFVRCRRSVPICQCGRTNEGGARVCVPIAH